MKHSKTLWLSAAAASVLVLSISGSASATTLCKNNTTPCENGAMYWSGTTIKGSLSSQSTFEPPIGDIVCKKSSFSATTNTNGGFVPVTATTGELSFSECNATVTVLQKGTLAVDHISGGMSGTVSQTGSEITVSYIGFHCIFSTNSTTIGTLFPSTHLGGGFYLDAELRVGGYIPRTGGNSGAFRGSFAYWEATYLMTSPAPLYVSNL